MIRNLLYSLSLHIFFIILLFFNDSINDIINKEITEINVLNIDSNFLKENNIKTTDEDLFPDLSLEDKINLYKMSKNKNNLKKSKNVSSNTTSNISLKKIIKNNDVIINDKYVLYLGPSDYKKYIKKQQEDINRKKQQEEQAIKENLNNIITNIEDNIEKTEKEKILETKEEEKEKQEDNINKILSQIDIGNNKEEFIVKDNKVQDVKVEDSGAELNNYNIVQQPEVEEQEVKEDTVVEDKVNLLNINADKIFTKKDIREIKKAIEKESGSNVLSIRERMDIQNQLISCYKNAIVQTGKNSLIQTSVTIQLFVNGIINTKEIAIKVIDDENKFSNEDYEIAINNAKIALAYCNPIRNLPATKYQYWKNINFIFDATK